LLGNEKSWRRDHTFHSWVQVELPKSFFAGGGLTSFWSTERFSGRFEIDSNGKRMDSQGRARPPHVDQLSLLQLNQLRFSIGKRFGEVFFLQYFVASTMGPQFDPTSHSLLLRFAF
jgi:hypothetical protein